MHNLLVIALLSYVTAVAVTDTLTQRIPNALTVPAAAVAVTLSIASHGVTGGLASSAGLLIGLAVFLPFYLLGGFGAGDVKALAAVGAFVGPQGVLLATICTLILGAACALIVLRHRRLFGPAVDARPMGNGRLCNELDRQSRTHQCS